MKLTEIQKVKQKMKKCIVCGVESDIYDYCRRCVELPWGCVDRGDCAVCGVPMDDPVKTTSCRPGLCAGDFDRLTPKERIGR